MKKILLITLVLMSLNAFASKDMFGNKQTEYKLEGNANIQCHETCDIYGNNCTDDCVR